MAALASNLKGLNISIFPNIAIGTVDFVAGHSILSNEDKVRFDSLQEQILTNKQITWAENINNSIRKGGTAPGGS